MTSEMTLKHSNTDFEARGVWITDAGQTSRACELHSELFLSTGGHVWWAQTGGTAKMKHRQESAERRLTEARVPRPSGSNRTNRVGISYKTELRVL